MKLLLSFFLLFNIALAEEVKVLKKGDMAPYDGVLFPKEKERELRTELEISEKKILTLRKLNDLNEKEIEVLNKRIELYQEKTKEIVHLQLQEDKYSNAKNALYFISGALITGLIGYGVIKAYR